MAKKDASQKQNARNRIREHVFSKHYPGDLLSENELTSDLSLSRTPVREALAELQGEGLIQIVPKKGIRIKKLSLDEIHAILDLREVIETRVAIQLAKQPHRRKAAKEELLKTHRQMEALYRKRGPVDQEDNERFWVLDMDFHAAICTLARYEPAAYILRRFQHQLRLVAVKALYDRPQMRAVLGEHKNIYDSITADHPKSPQIRRVVAEHLHNAKCRWFIEPFA